MRIAINLLPLLVSLTFVVACSGGSSTSSQESSPPTVTSNQAPILSRIDDLTIMAGASANVAIQVTDADTSIASVTLTSHSSNPSLIADNQLIMSGVSNDRTLEIRPSIGQLGSATITVSANDHSGGLSEVRFVVTVVAAPTETGPSVTFNHGPSATTTEAFALFEFGAINATRFECALDGNGYYPCSSPWQLPSLSNVNQYQRLTLGAHEFKVRGVDANGIYGSAASWRWTVASIAASGSADFVAQRLIDNEVLPAPATTGGWKGIFRINCEFDHAAYDDPIVFPGMNGMAHLHMFYGAKNVDGNTTFDQLNRSPAAGCSGGTLNRSSYWMPALLAPSYNNAGQRLVDSNGAPAWKVIKAKVGEGDRSAQAAHEVFYYSAAVDDLNSIGSPPIGLRLIAGSNTTTPASEPQSTAIARWHCLSWGSSDAAGGPWSTTIPECLVNTNTPDMLRFDLFFPSCWNGIDLDSANHKDHMAYPIVLAGKWVCPSSHPRPVARISFHYSFPIFPYDVDPISRTTKNFRLASDNYTVSNSNGGLSLHGDWFNGWHPEAMDMLVQGCIRSARDCHDGNFALISNNGAWKGSVSLGPLIDAKGSEHIPEIINEGLGMGHGH